MSNYPQAPSYGANPNPPYLPPAYPNQYLQPDDGRTNQGQMAGNYDASMNAYAYNRSAPTFSAAAVASGVPPLPIYQGWNQESVPLPPYTVQQNGGQYNNGYGNNVQSQQYYPPPMQSGYQQQPHLLQNKPYEQDLSEGEFEDGAGSTSTPNVGYGISQYRGNDGTGYIDTAQRAVYPRAQEYSPQQSYPANNYNHTPREQSQATRQQSDSYSPYASPSIQNNAERPSGAHHQNAYAPGQSQESVVPTPVAAPAQSYSWPQKSAHQAEPKPGTNGHNSSQSGETATHRATSTTQPASSVIMNSTGSARGKSVAESRKSAQGAILSLWPYGVRLQTYIDEGFKEDLVKPLIIDANLLQTSLESGPGREKAGAIQPEESRGSQYQGYRLENPSKAENGAFEDASRSSKAVQDTTAPLSATTNGNLAAKVTSAQTPTDQVKPPIAAAPHKSVSMIEKDKALKSKMDALRKSREDRAQKAAAKSVPSSTIPAVVAVLDEKSKVLVDEAAALKEVISLPATNSLSKSPSIPKNDLQLPVETPPSVPKEQLVLGPVTKPAPLQHQLPAIPGLFLASTIASPALQASAQRVQSPIHGNQRKRPVAADFDEPMSSMATFKRPFGQNRNEKPLVIDVSEEEIDSDDEDVAMDLESVADDSPVQPARKHSDHLLSTIQTQPVTSTSAQSKPWSPPSFSSAASTPPPLQQLPRSALGRPEILQRKESEIEELKKKIAEAVAKKRKSKQTSSGTRTPRATDTPATAEINPTIQPDEPGATQPTPSIITQQLAGVQETKIEGEQREEAELRAVEIARASEQRRITAEQKRMQRNKMASDIAALKAAGEQKRAEIERRKAEVEEMEALRMATLQNQQRMEEEMLLLSQDEEDENESQTGDLIQQDTHTTQIVEAQVPEFSISSSSVMEESNQRVSPTVEHTPTKIFEIPAAAKSGEPLESASKDVGNPVQTNGVSSPAVVDHYGAANGTPHSVGHVVISLQPSSEDRIDESKAVLSTDQALEAALQEAVRIEADSHAHTEEDTDMDVSSASEPTQLVQDLLPTPTEETPNSPEYSPELHRDLADIPDIPDRESDGYEPPEATPPVGVSPQDFEVMDAAPTANSPSLVDSPPFSPAPPADISEPADMVLDIDPVQTPREKASDVESSSAKLPISDESQTQMVETHAQPADRIQSFSPYESPLKLFRAYRFHPQFKQEISGGLKSMTYSHRIDPDKELCRFELAGGICNDATCDLQHFREIGLPDDAVLTALGSPDEFQGEQRERFCVGLKEVLLKMRMNRVRDFNIIAAEIIAHRVKFLGDNSKVLPLEGTNI